MRSNLVSDIRQDAIDAFGIIAVDPQSQKLSEVGNLFFGGGFDCIGNFHGQFLFGTLIIIAVNNR
jgi:hypothetical protein